VARSEQQRFFALFKEVLRAYGREPGEMDLGLFFLHSLSPEEALTVLHSFNTRSLQSGRERFSDRTR
jgi:hypothetical protein